MSDNDKYITTAPSGRTFEYININGIFVPNSPMFNGPDSAIRKIPTMKFRKNDVLICGFFRSGTNWTWEIVNMLMNQKAVYQRDRKTRTVIEVQKQEILEKMTPPRIMCSHLHFYSIPKDFIDKKSKFVCILRNPKDVLVSFYYYLNAEESPISWDDCFYLFKEKDDTFMSWFGNTKSWEKAADENPDIPIHFIFYEDLKKNTVQEIAKLADFLNVQNDPEFIRKVADKVSFMKMRTAKLQYLSEALLENPDFGKEFGDSMEKRQQYYRNGEVGDWKTHFTVAQSEQFDRLIETRMKDTKLKFDYDLC